MKMTFDLKMLYEHFSDIGEKRWGQTLQLEKLENTFRPVKEGKEGLSLKHIRAIKDDCAFARWWKMPEISEKDLELLKGMIVKLTPRDKKVVRRLFDLLKNIEILSCVLRFVDPQNYGILSPPVEYLINVRGRHDVQKYMNYLKDLEELKEIYGFSRIADVDMALWSLANLINFPELRNHAIYDEIFKAYEQAANPVKKIMAWNSLEQIKEERSLYKAELFLDSDFVVAGLIAGRELDVFVKALCDKHKIKKMERTVRKDFRYLSIPELSDKLANDKRITKEENDDIKTWWKYRCDLTHEHEIHVTRNEVGKMINGVSKLKEKK